MLRRASSFKRKVQRRSEAESAAATQDIKGVRIKGALKRLNGSKNSAVFAVCTPTSKGGCLLALHKGANDWTPFRAFPDELIAVESVVKNQEFMPRPTGATVEQQCLGIIVEGQLAVTFAFEDHDESYDAWVRALTQGADAPPRQSVAAKKERSSEHDVRIEKLRALQRQLQAARQQVAADGEKIRACREKHARYQKEILAIVENLPPPTNDEDGGAATGGRPPPLPKLNNWGAAPIEGAV